MKHERPLRSDALTRNGCHMKPKRMSRFIFIQVAAVLLALTASLLALLHLVRQSDQALPIWALTLIGAVMLFCFHHVLHDLLLRASLQSIGSSPPTSHGSSSDRAIIAFPVISSSVRSIDEVIQSVIYHAKSQDLPAAFVVLLDLFDSDEKVSELDQVILDDAAMKCREVEQVCAGRLVLLYRERVWNPQEGAWIGRERKRGKLEDFNEFITRRGAGTSFRVILGNIDPLQSANWVMTLDSDSRLQEGALSKLVVKIQNASEARKWLIQPAPVQELRQQATLYQFLQADWSSRVRSQISARPNAYQEILGRGSYFGKAIYSVKEYAERVEGVIPDNTILSHDLVEGELLNSQICSHIFIYECPPETAFSDINRRSRWIRGDLQTLFWSLGAGELDKLGMFKVIDNARRAMWEMVSFALVVLLCVLSDPLTILGVCILLFYIPQILHNWSALFGSGSRGSDSISLALKVIAQATVVFIALPAAALSASTAAVLAFWRYYFSKRNLLEWSASGNDTAAKNASLLRYYKLLPGCALAFMLCALIGIFLGKPVAFYLAAVWLLAPLVLGALSRGIVREPAKV